MYAAPMLGLGQMAEESSPEDTTEPTESLAECLNSLLGDAFTMYVQAHAAHWNCKGQMFSQYHEFFGEIYEDVHGSLDDIAENILKLGYDAPASLTALMQAREASDPMLTADTPMAMATALLNTNGVVLDSLEDCFEASTRENEMGIQNFIAERIDQHKKWAWQLRSSIDAQPQAQVPMEKYNQNHGKGGQFASSGAGGSISSGGAAVQRMKIEHAIAGKRGDTKRVAEIRQTLQDEHGLKFRPLKGDVGVWEPVKKYNQNHGKGGRFSSGPGGGSGGLRPRPLGGHGTNDLKRLHSGADNNVRAKIQTEMAHRGYSYDMKTHTWSKASDATPKNMSTPVHLYRNAAKLSGKDTVDGAKKAQSITSKAPGRIHDTGLKLAKTAMEAHAEKDMGKKANLFAKVRQHVQDVKSSLQYSPGKSRLTDAEKKTLTDYLVKIDKDAFKAERGAIGVDNANNNITSGPLS
jgi:starvation-inducible DNA-binding protein